MKETQRDTLATCLMAIFGHVDESFVDAAIARLRPLELAGGETLFHEGDEHDGVYFVISGRLRALSEERGFTRVVGEIGRGETVGEMAALTGEPRSATVVAIRDSVLAHASREAFDELMGCYPEVSIHMARIVVARLRRSPGRSRAPRPRTVCLLAITEGVSASAVGERLALALDRWAVTTLETAARVDARLGAGAAQAARGGSDAYNRVSLWLDDVEFWNELVLLATDEGDTGWTRRCLRQADEVLLLARADAAPRLHPVEERYLAGATPLTAARQTLVLLHDPATTHPAGTRAWLDRRAVDRHLHVRLERPRDVERLARVVSGNAIGLALGGGGARGFAHLGVYRALEEAGIEVDLVAGTSIGAAMGAYVAFDLPAAAIIERARRTFARSPTSDVSVLPLLSLVKGRRLKATIDRAVREAAGADVDIADTWRSLRCVATNFSRATEQVLDRGPLARCIRASVSIPVALPPVPWQGDLLVDGSVFNNFPVDVVAGMRAGRVIGVDLARERTGTYEGEEMPSSWQLLRDRMRARDRRRYRVPGLGAILMGTTILYSSSRRGQAREATDLYFNPDFGRIGLLDWDSYDRIVDAGYRHAQEVLGRMSDEELAPYRARA